jgi:hypothetical protein
MLIMLVFLLVSWLVTLLRCPSKPVYNVAVSRATPTTFFQARAYSTSFSYCLLQLLMEEASKLESAESFSLKKTRDKNSLLDTEMTDWMLNSVQKAQIGETDMCVGCSASTAGRLCGCTVLCVLRGVYNYYGVVRSGDFNTQCLLIFKRGSMKMCFCCCVPSVADGCSSVDYHSIYTLVAQTSCSCLANHFRLGYAQARPALARRCSPPAACRRTPSCRPPAL